LHVYVALRSKVYGLGLILRPSTIVIE
jgi:hypothetical protein